LIPFLTLCASLAAARAELEDGERMPFVVLLDKNMMWEAELREKVE